MTHHLYLSWYKQNRSDLLKKYPDSAFIGRKYLFFKKSVVKIKIITPLLLGEIYSIIFFKFQSTFRVVRERIRFWQRFNVELKKQQYFHGVIALSK